MAAQYALSEYFVILSTKKRCLINYARESLIVSEKGYKIRNM